MEVNCASCKAVVDIPVDFGKVETFPFTIASYRRLLEKKRWVVQENGDFIDACCSAKCAK